MSLLQYIKLKLVALIFRFLYRLTPGLPKASPSSILNIPSRQPGRSVKTHVYTSAARPAGAQPVLLNFHGSGFLLPMHGSDDEFCRRMAQETPFTVVDASYRLAPEHPFPAALEDVQDVVEYVLRRPEAFDLSRLAMAGFSAGANFALAAATIFPPDTFKCLIAFYPPCDISVPPAQKKAPDPTGKPIPDVVASLFNQAYIPDGTAASHPLISVGLTDALDRFPEKLLMITAACDNLAMEAEALADRIQSVGKSVTKERMEGCEHAWDKSCLAGTPEAEAKERAYGLAVEMLATI